MISTITLQCPLNGIPLVGTYNDQDGYLILHVADENDDHRGDAEGRDKNYDDAVAFCRRHSGYYVTLADVLHHLRTVLGAADAEAENEDGYF